MENKASSSSSKGSLLDLEFWHQKKITAEMINRQVRPKGDHIKYINIRILSILHRQVLILTPSPDDSTPIFLGKPQAHPHKYKYYELSWQLARKHRMSIYRTIDVPFTPNIGPDQQSDRRLWCFWAKQRELFGSQSAVDLLESFSSMRGIDNEVDGSSITANQARQNFSYFRQYIDYRRQRIKLVFDRSQPP